MAALVVLNGSRRSRHRGALCRLPVPLYLLFPPLFLEGTRVHANGAISLLLFCISTRALALLQTMLRAEHARPSRMRLRV